MSVTDRLISLLIGKIHEAQGRLTDELHMKEIARDQMIAAERRAHSNQNALEEARTLLDQADRQRRNIENELCDSNETLSSLTVQNQALEAAKRKIDGEIMALNVRD